jgi:hypothetical protein
VWRLAGWTAFENGVETGSQDRQAEGFPYGFLAVPQYETERILESCLHRHGGVTWRGLTFTDFTDGTDSVKARIEVAAGASHLFIHYRSSALVRDDMPPDQGDLAAPHAGDRAPDALGLGQPFVGHRFRLRERLELGYHVLIGYTGSDRTETDQRAFAGLLEMLRQRLDSSSAGLTIVAPDAGYVDCERMPWLFDHDSSFQRVYAAAPGMVWLVRPDGHIAWRCDRADENRLTRFIDRIEASQV